MPSRSQRLEKLHGLLEQVKKIEELRKAALNKAAQQLVEDREALLGGLSKSEEAGQLLTRSYIKRLNRKTDDLRRVDEVRVKQQAAVEKAARRSGAAKRLTETAAMREEAEAETEELTQILERVAAFPARLP